MTCDAKEESLTTKVEREAAAHDVNGPDSDAWNLPHAARARLGQSCQHSIDAWVARSLDIAFVSTD